MFRKTAVPSPAGSGGQKMKLLPLTSRHGGILQKIGTPHFSPLFCAVRFVSFTCGLFNSPANTTAHAKSTDTRVKKNQLDAQLVLSVFRQPLHVSGVSRPIIRTYNRMDTTAGTYYSF